MVFRKRCFSARISLQKRKKCGLNRFSPLKNGLAYAYMVFGKTWKVWLKIGFPTLKWRDFNKRGSEKAVWLFGLNSALDGSRITL